MAALKTNEATHGGGGRLEGDWEATISGHSHPTLTLTAFEALDAVKDNWLALLTFSCPAGARYAFRPHANDH
jgi:hypothetical protein